MLEFGEFTEVVEVEVFEEDVGGGVEVGSAGALVSSGDAQEATFEECAHGATAVDAADGVDFGACDGLAVGDDREALEGGLAETDLALGQESADQSAKVRVGA